ncbi:unnamed protein product [Rotaria magnacalcarata]|uniref:Uncharacterized protein n=1 Tax=Rotaria magnacalcarata TaxID=392030 RepID=A0A815J5M5_9BILA|nr:unnamed protein product [Rotaria magnacalcarata]CAF2056481.1 unnamed protein product [Rotaria magnacalcarata]CAF2132877.1 unnamed protein product [Rotaria magnacalcarata]CAF2270183.1 unnamed protein product [Rotaria magnacalcarata]CAF4081232.1 unnamed protein product [Rotaria magnacalcarata]
MARRIFFLILTVLILPSPTLEFLFNAKVLSPSSNVHVDVVNYVKGSIESHHEQFHHSWRDYSILLLLVIVLGTCFLSCCGIGIYCIYRNLLVRIQDTSSPNLKNPCSGPIRNLP